ncbi:hypothetical protein D3C71_2159960 [compost metagenome]
MTRLELRLHIQAMFEQLRRDGFDRRLHIGIHEPVHLVAYREMHRLGDALAPAALMSGLPDQRDR